MKSYTKEEIEEMIRKAEFDMWRITNEMNSIAFDKGEERISYEDMLKYFIESLLHRLED